MAGALSSIGAKHASRTLGEHFALSVYIFADSEEARDTLPSFRLLLRLPRGSRTGSIPI